LSSKEFCYFRKYGEKDWQLISQKLYYLNLSNQKIYRCPKQCREHWNCYLNPKLKKGPWSKDEDLLLLNCIKKNNGLKRWAEMISLFNGRTENALKNRFTLIIEK
jgi:myb proto-oncogene protein